MPFRTRTRADHIEPCRRAVRSDRNRLCRISALTINLEEPIWAGPDVSCPELQPDDLLPNQQWSRRALAHERARLIWHVRRTENEDIGSVGIGVACNFKVFIAARGCFDGHTRFHQAGILGRFDLRRGNEEDQMPFWLLRTTGAFVAGRHVHRGSRHARAAARSRNNDRGIGHYSRAGVNRTTPPSFVRRTGCSNTGLVSAVVPVIIVFGSGVRSQSPAPRVDRASWHRRTFGRRGLSRGSV